MTFTFKFWGFAPAVCLKTIDLKTRKADCRIEEDFSYS